MCGDSILILIFGVSENLLFLSSSCFSGKWLDLKANYCCRYTFFFTSMIVGGRVMAHEILFVTEHLFFFGGGGNVFRGMHHLICRYPTKWKSFEAEGVSSKGLPGRWSEKSNHQVTLRIKGPWFGLGGHKTYPVTYIHGFFHKPLL